MTVPFHSGTVLHPKIVKQVLETIEEAAQSTATENNPHKRQPSGKHAHALHLILGHPQLGPTT
jgi:hypothetical protein